MTSEYYPGHGDWSGLSFAAFRDVALQTDRAWFVIDTDSGIGVLCPQKSSQLIIDNLDLSIMLAWNRAGQDIIVKRELYELHHMGLMRAVSENFLYSVLNIFKSANTK
jgi:hypothetical protein